MNQYIEFEALFYPVDKDEIRSQLKKLGAKLVTPERKMRKSIIDGRFHPEFKCHFLRIRDEGDGIVRLSAKTHADPGGKISDKKEIDISVSDFDKTIEIFKAANLEVDKYQESLREDWELDKSHISIDTWPGLEVHVEIEGDSEEHVKKIAEKLGFDWDKKIITSRVEMYSQLYGLTEDEVLKKIEKLTFEDNPFADLPIIGEIDYSIQKSL